MNCAKCDINYVNPLILVAYFLTCKKCLLLFLYKIHYLYTCRLKPKGSDLLKLWQIELSHCSPTLDEYIFVTERHNGSLTRAIMNIHDDDDDDKRTSFTSQWCFSMLTISVTVLLHFCWRDSYEYSSQIKSLKIKVWLML